MRPQTLMLLLVVAAPVAAGDTVLPMPATASYRSECGSCHTAYAPGFLPAASWSRLMDELNRHFGDDASLKPAQRDLIASQLQALAMDTPNGNSAIAARNAGRWASEPPLRITPSPFFRYLHDEIPDSIWKRPKIVSKSNCVACHLRADEGRYPESEIQIPK
jgi:hypothetical protein